MDPVDAVFILSTCIKLLLIPSYKSTDFEVHRNWLAITHSLPLSQWYYEDTSEWTLDYPPLFAWFEKLLSFPASIVDPHIVEVSNLRYSVFTCVLFQRISVIITDCILWIAVKHFLRTKQLSSSLQDVQTTLLAYLLLANYGLMVVDHIHFQYNGFLFGILVLSISCVFKGQDLLAAFLFAVLLNFKHLFLYMAPAYFIYLLKHYCFTNKGFSLLNFIKLGTIVATVFLISFGPFVILGQLGQVISRLFPFKRGLCHAYWAANFWAIYSTIDKGAAIVGSRLGLVHSTQGGGMTSGLVGDMTTLVLPSVPPVVTVILTLVTWMPAVIHLWFTPATPRSFLKCLVLCSYGSFLCGWHVHEKAILMITIPLSILAVEDTKSARVFMLISTAGHIALFPLLYQPAELPIKISLCFVYWCVSYIGLNYTISFRKRPQRLLSTFDKLYLLSLVFIQIYCCFLHDLLGLHSTLQFLPLLLTSVSCAFGVAYSWVLFYYNVLNV
ncbi:dolichyl pyrophosphate Glc1Man9GlcNAc2 alpha-1,3-glucosyltransferase-like isoform X2 [Dysidea avara]|uniref:dolichyl pyrophosphate Glc1Man9GlcNAc2 alpha-1,3-glucosyltransferase-like isoform X2 n=1 Tax=Dysidea avara TaxID=196820 RepID=UPI0033313B7E